MKPLPTQWEVTGISGVQCASCNKITICWDGPGGEYPGVCGHCGNEEEPCSTTHLCAVVPLDHYGESAGYWVVKHGYTREPWGLSGIHCVHPTENGLSARGDHLLDDFVWESANQAWQDDMHAQTREEDGL